MSKQEQVIFVPVSNVMCRDRKQKQKTEQVLAFTDK